MVEYGAGTAVALIVVYFTRAWSLPVIQWAVELCIYTAAFHVALHYIVKVAAWFNYESQMKMLKDERVSTGWQTPLIEFWKQELYKPSWILWFEAVFVVGVFVLMVRLRPMKTQKSGAKREALRKGVAPQVRPPGEGARPKGR
jgi:hypothetical protein